MGEVSQRRATGRIKLLKPRKVCLIRRNGIDRDSFLRATEPALSYFATFRRA